MIRDLMPLMSVANCLGLMVLLILIDSFARTWEPIVKFQMH